MSDNFVVDTMTSVVLVLGALLVAACIIIMAINFLIEEIAVPIYRERHKYHWEVIIQTVLMPFYMFCFIQSAIWTGQHHDTYLFWFGTFFTMAPNMAAFVLTVDKIRQQDLGTGIFIKGKGIRNHE